MSIRNKSRSNGPCDWILCIHCFKWFSKYIYYEIIYMGRWLPRILCINELFIVLLNHCTECLIGHHVHKSKYHCRSDIIVKYWIVRAETVIYKCLFNTESTHNVKIVYQIFIPLVLLQIIWFIWKIIRIYNCMYT